MDPTKIVVLVLCLVTLGFLVWVEMNSRRNTKALKQQQSKQSSEDAE
jgi:hypothetical protein